MNEHFINTFIDVMNKKLEELHRNEIMLQTKLIIAEQTIASLIEDKTKLEASLNKKTSKAVKEEI